MSAENSLKIAGGECRASEIGPREHILLTAAHQFRQRGYRATTVREIAREVGILSGSLFHHFASKEQMLVEMLQEAALSMCEGGEALLASITNPTDKLRALVRYELDCFIGSETRDYFAVLVSEWRDVPVSLQPELQELRRRYARISGSVLEACHAAGRLRLAPDAAARVLHSVTTGAVTWFRSDGRYTVDEFADCVTDLLLKDQSA